MPATRRSAGQSGRPWTRSEEKLLGRHSDDQIAKFIARSPSAVRLRRQKKGIFRPHPKYNREWTGEELKLLGKMSDKDLAARFDRTAAAVAFQRTRRQIPMFKPGRKWVPLKLLRKTRRTEGRFGRQWSPEEEALLGQI